MNIKNSWYWLGGKANGTGSDGCFCWVVLFFYGGDGYDAIRLIIFWVLITTCWLDWWMRGSGGEVYSGRSLHRFASEWMKAAGRCYCFVRAWYLTGQCVSKQGARKGSHSHLTFHLRIVDLLKDLWCVDEGRWVGSFSDGVAVAR